MSRDVTFDENSPIKDIKIIDSKDEEEKFKVVEVEHQEDSFDKCLQ